VFSKCAFSAVKNLF